MGSVSAVRIANIALGKIGSDRINSLTEDTEQARAVNARYDEILEEILCEHAWTFAQKRAVLATVSGTPVMTEDGMTVIYQKPTDCLKVNFTNNADAQLKLEDDKILSDLLVHNDNEIHNLRQHTYLLLYILLN